MNVNSGYCKATQGTVKQTQLRLWQQKILASISKMCLVAATVWSRREWLNSRNMAPIFFFNRFCVILIYLFAFEAIQRLVIDKASLPCSKQYLGLIPTGDLEEFYLPLTMFDLTVQAKNGCGGIGETC